MRLVIEWIIVCGLGSSAVGFLFFDRPLGFSFRLGGI